MSGGQSGADRAALDVGLELGFEVGGWLPRDRWAEDGPLPDRYPNMRETESEDPAVRTEWNVRDADATVVLSHGPLSGGAALTVSCARRLARPLLHLDLDEGGAERAAQQLAEWLGEHRVAVLNVAGPRASQDPEIYRATRRVLGAALADQAALRGA